MPRLLRLLRGLMPRTHILWRGISAVHEEVGEQAELDELSPFCFLPAHLPPTCIPLSWAGVGPAKLDELGSGAHAQRS